MTMTIADRTPAQPRVEDWLTTIQSLKRLLQAEHGCVSSQALRKELERKGIADARDLVVKLRFFDFDAEAGEQTPRPEFRFYHKGKSFYSAEMFHQVEAKTEAQAETAGAAVDANPIAVPVLPAATSVAPIESLPSEDDEIQRRPNRQEEARLVTYIVDALEGVYDADSKPENTSHVFDVHNARAGTDFENVDLVALHWRSTERVELVTVEVKLAFTARLVQQANNYRRFSDRVWIAVPTTSQEAGLELRETDPLLFEYVTDSGLGILACRRARGRRYEITPVQWPRRCSPDPVERDAFLERHRELFEEAQVLEPRHRTRFPKVR